MKILLTSFVLFFSNPAFCEYIMIQSWFDDEYNVIGTNHWDEYGTRFASYKDCEEGLLNIYKKDTPEFGSMEIAKFWNNEINVVIYRNDGSIQVNFTCTKLF